MPKDIHVTIGTLEDTANLVALAKLKEIEMPDYPFTIAIDGEETNIVRGEE